MLPKRFFCGHFRFLAIETKRPLRFVTFLRDPFKRTESYYRSWREHGPQLIAGDNRAVAEAVRWTGEVTYEAIRLFGEPDPRGAAYGTCKLPI